MKKILHLTVLAIAFFALPRMMFGQNGVDMLIHKNDGSTLRIPVDSVQHLRFIPSQPPYYSYMIPWRYSPNDPVFARAYFEVTTLDTVSFFKNQGRMAFGGTRSHDTIRIEGPRKGLYGFFNPADSVTFLEYAHNKNVVELPYKYFDPDLRDSTGGDFQSAAWIGNKLYATGPIVVYTLDSNEYAGMDSTLMPFDTYWRSLFLTKNSLGTRLLGVNSRYSDLSIGTLFEQDLISGTRTILDSINLVSNAAYIPGTNNLVYYCYGSNDTVRGKAVPLDSAGYYFLDRTTGNRHLLFHYVSDYAEGETINGFDISPDGKKLLIASVGPHQPVLYEYDLQGHTRDTIPTYFDIAHVGTLLWVRYSPNGEKILYGTYPGDIFAGGFASEPGEIGVIDKSTAQKHVLNGSPDNQGVYMCVLPSWSPDGKMIVYGACYISTHPKGYISSFRLTILRVLD
jgi:hypothetical protein